MCQKNHSPGFTLIPESAAVTTKGREGVRGAVMFTSSLREAGSTWHHGFLLVRGPSLLLQIPSTFYELNSIDKLEFSSLGRLKSPGLQSPEREKQTNKHKQTPFSQNMKEVSHLKHVPESSF